jgi:hypothetical protein
MSNCSFIDNQIGASFLANAVDSIVIANCEFLNNGLALNYPNNGRVENCEFSDNGTAVQAAYNCEIQNNTFFYNILAIEATVDANIHNNQINNNAEGIIISNVTSIQDSPSIYDNEICGNTYYNVNNNTNMNYSLFSNCFCDLDSAQIEAYLIDGYDDITKGLINYQIYDSSCTVLLGNVVKFGAGVGLEENAFDFSFENPVQHDLQLLGYPEVKQIVLQNTSGQTFYFTSSTYNTFDLSRLAPGYYFIVKLDQQGVSKALVKY